MNLKELMKYSKDKRLEFIDLKFTDIPGLWQHITIPIQQLDEDLVIHGIGFDGSSIRGFQPINESDMLVKPDPAKAFIDPFIADPTLSMICNVKDPLTQILYSRDPRNVGQKNVSIAYISRVFRSEPFYIRH